MKNTFAEIIESSITNTRAQTWQWDNYPQFGSLLAINTNEKTIFGLVYDIKTGTFDGQRTPYAYQKTEEQLKQEQPQIFEFLQTTFSLITVGYQKEGKLWYQLPSEPVKIHSFVSHATKEQIQLFFQSDKYLYLLFNYTSFTVPLDELLLALLKQLSDQSLLDEALINKFLQTFSLLTANDYRRLKIFLERAEPIINIGR